MSKVVKVCQRLFKVENYPYSCQRLSKLLKLKISLLEHKIKLLKVVKGCQRLSKFVKGCQRLLKVFKDCQRFSKVVKGCQRLSKVFKGC